MLFFKKCAIVLVATMLLSTVIFQVSVEKTTVVPLGIPMDIVSVPYDEYAWIDMKDLTCLQQNIYFEGRNQTGEGMAAIGLATINRLTSDKFPDTICGVITQARRWKGRLIYRQCHFSWYCDRLSDDPDLENSIERLAWEHAGAVAFEVLSGEIEDFTHGSTHYHYYDMAVPYWAKVSAGYVEQTVRADDHIFYRLVM